MVFVQNFISFSSKNKFKILLFVQILCLSFVGYTTDTSEIGIVSRCCLTTRLHYIKYSYIYMLCIYIYLVYMLCTQSHIHIFMLHLFYTEDELYTYIYISIVNIHPHTHRTKNLTKTLKSTKLSTFIVFLFRRRKQGEIHIFYK